jgi:hypothetical protein
MTSTLSDLPVEIFHAIIDELPQFEIDTAVSGRHDLMQLRLVSRNIVIKTKVRFAQEFSKTLVVPVPTEGSERIKHILVDTVLRGSIQNIDIYIDYCDRLFSNNPPKDCKSFRNYLVNGPFSEDFRHLLRLAKYMTSLTILSSSKFLRNYSLSFQQKEFTQNWRELARAVLVLVFANDDHCPEHLQIGDSEPQHYTPTSTSPLQGFPKTSTVLSKLTSLHLSELMQPNHTESTPLSSQPGATHSLSDFIALSPQLTKFEYTGVHPAALDPSHPMENFCVPKNLPLPPQLTEFVFGTMSVPGSMLMAGLRSCSATLKGLHFRDICLTDVTWETLFAFLRETLRLEYFRARRLMTGDYEVVFLLVHRDRLVVYDLDSRLEEWGIRRSGWTCT